MYMDCTIAPSLLHFVVYRKNGVSERPMRMQKVASERSLRFSLLPCEGATRKRGPGPNVPKTGPLLVRCLGAVIGVMGSTYINRVRLQELKSLLLEAQKGPVSLQEAIKVQASMHKMQQDELSNLIDSLRTALKGSLKDVKIVKQHLSHQRLPLFLHPVLQKKRFKRFSNTAKEPKGSLKALNRSWSIWRRTSGRSRPSCRRSRRPCSPVPWRSQSSKPETGSSLYAIQRLSFKASVKLRKDWRCRSTKQVYTIQSWHVLRLLCDCASSVHTVERYLKSMQAMWPINTLENNVSKDYNYCPRL